METQDPVAVETALSYGLRSYLRGMETLFEFLHNTQPVTYSDPPYEAWKQLEKVMRFLENYGTPILPTRHGNWGRRSGKNLDFSSDSDPTYEAWKLL